MDAKIALKNPESEAFETIIKDNFKINALIIKENNPKVKIVIGKDNNLSIGLSVELSKPNIIVRINSDLIEPIYIPSTKFDTIYKDIAFIIINSDIFFIFKSFLLKL